MTIIRNTAILTLLFLLWTGNLQAFNIYSDFPGGNIIIDKIKNDTVWFRPDLRDTKGEWFYWYFAVFVYHPDAESDEPQKPAQILVDF